MFIKNKKWFSIFEMVIVMGLIWLFSVVVVWYQSYVLQKNSFLETSNKLALAHTLTSQLLDRYLKDANEIILYNNHKDSSKNIDWKIYNWASFNLDDLKWDGSANACKMLDLDNYDAIWFSSDYSIDPIVIGVKKELVNGKDTRTLVIYKYNTREEALKQWINFLDNNNRVSSSWFSNWNSDKCWEFSITLLDSWIFTPEAWREFFHIPNFKIPIGWLEILIPESYEENNNKKHWFIEFRFKFQLNYTYQNTKRKLIEEFKAFYILRNK